VVVVEGAVIDIIVVYLDRTGTRLGPIAIVFTVGACPVQVTTNDIKRDPSFLENVSKAATAQHTAHDMRSCGANTMRDN
jgi:hypothetical protein